MGIADKGNYQPRFDFGVNANSDTTQTGTLAELIDELNYEKDYTVSGRVAKQTGTSGDAVSIKSLHRTLEFVRQVTGDTFTGTKEPLPLSTLKTIKLLYNTNDTSDRHLFNFLAPPHSDRPTMEFSTSSSIARDQAGAATIHWISDQLAKEIEPQRIESFNSRFQTAEHLNQAIERENDEIYRSITDRLGDDEKGLAQAYRTLAKSIDNMRYEKIGDALQAPLNEMVYCHLRGLGFAHFIAHHRTFMEEIRVQHPIHSIDGPMGELCRVLSEERRSAILPTAKVISVNDFPKLVAIFSGNFRSLVKAATGMDTRKPTFIENLPRAQRILTSYAFRTYDETDLDAPALSMIDIVAALCSVRYQQEVKTPYEPYWPSQVQQGSSPQRHFDKEIDKDDPYQHQGVLMVYLYRFYDFLHAFTGVTESRRAWVDYQLARMEAYVRILGLLDINAIVASANHFEVICLEAASAAQLERSPA